MFCLICLQAGGQNGEQDENINIKLEEVDIISWSDRTIIKKAIKNLPKKNDGSLLIGRGQLIQIIECNGRVVQLDREYGMYCTNRFNYKRESNIEDNWALNFYPFFNARSFRYDSVGEDTLKTNYLNIRANVKGKNGIRWIDDDISYDARHKYMFQIIRTIYLYGPIYSRNYSDYTFKLEESTGDIFKYSFEPSDGYPIKNPLYVKGSIEIDAETMTLKAIIIDEMGLYRRNYDDIISSKESEKKKYIDYKDCFFKVNSLGEIDYALVHLPWDGNNDYDLRTKVRSKPNDVKCCVTECWQLDTKERIGKNNYKLHKTLSWEKFYNLMVYGMAGKLRFSRYEKKIIDSIEWAFDVTKAEKELNSRTPIEQQYTIQSRDYYSSYLEWDNSVNDSTLLFNTVIENLILNPIRNEWFPDE